MPIFSVDVSYIENTDYSTEAQLEQINKYSRANIQKLTNKNQLYFHIIMRNSLKKEIKKNNSFTITSSIVKWLGIHLSRKVNDLYSKDYKILMKEVKIDINKWKASPRSWIGEILILLTWS